MNMMNDLSVGDYLILTVSRGSQYLTSAQILEIGESGTENEGKIKVMYSSTIATKWIKPNNSSMLKYNPKPFILDGRLGLCRDCVNRIIEEGQNCAYRNKTSQNFPISYGKIKKVESNLWVILDNGERVRNNGIFILD